MVSVGPHVCFPFLVSGPHVCFPFLARQGQEPKDLLRQEDHRKQRKYLPVDSRKGKAHPPQAMDQM